MFTTEMLANLEGLERGPAGNTCLAAAFSLAQDLPEDAVIVVAETEYTGAGKHIQPQLTFARQNGIDIRFGDPSEDKPGINIILPSNPALIKCKDADIWHMRESLIKRALKKNAEPTDEDVVFLAEETNTDEAFVRETIAKLQS